MSTYEPGTVAVVTWDNASRADAARGESDVRTERALRTKDGYWALASGHLHCISDEPVTDVRPLVVLDLADDAPEAVARVLRRAGYDWLAVEIEAQTKPPRIPEPGLWGVVEAGHEHLGTGRSEFVRVNLEGDFQWVDRTSEADWSTWDRLEDPTLVRDGIEVAS